MKFLLNELYTHYNIIIYIPNANATHATRHPDCCQLNDSYQLTVLDTNSQLIMSHLEFHSAPSIVIQNNNEVAFTKRSLVLEDKEPS